VSQSISKLGEFGLIQRFISKLSQKKTRIVVGPGDDCAVIKTGSSSSLLCTTDMLIEGVHFRRDWMTPRQIGAKAIRVNLSDIAAMGGVARYALISLGLPARTTLKEADQLFEGMSKTLESVGGTIIGGDVNASQKWVINVTLLGEPSHGPVMTRSGARVGDAIYVTGTLGDSSLGLQALKKKKKTGYGFFIQRHYQPPLRLEIGRYLACQSLVHSMIDISDGLGGDMQHILDASHVGAEIRMDRIPVSKKFISLSRKMGSDPHQLILSGGEDYELLLTASPKLKIPKKVKGVPITKIGYIIPYRSEIRFVNSQDRRCDIGLRGFKHF